MRHVLTGRARRDGDQVRLAVSLVDTASGRIVWTELRDVPRAELGALVGDVAGGIARTMIVEYGDAMAAADARRSSRRNQVQADDLAMQGMAELLRSVSREHWERSRRLFEQAVTHRSRRRRRGLAGVSAGQHQPRAMGMERRSARATIARAEQTLAQLDLIAPDLLMTPPRAREHGLHCATTGPGWPRSATGWCATIPNEPAAHHHRCSALLRLARFEESHRRLRSARSASARATRACRPGRA